MAQKVARFVQPARAVAELEAALAPALLERALSRHVRGFLDRERVRAGERGDLVGDYLSEPAIDLMRELFGRPVKLDKKFLRSVVQQDAVKHLIREVTEETISRFLASLRGGTGGGIMGSVGRGAFGLASTMGKALMGGLGPGASATLDRAQTAFIEGSLSMILAHVVEVMAAPESAQKMADMAGMGLEGALAMPVKTVWDRVHMLPKQDLDAILAVVPGVLAHNLARPEVRAGIVAEVTAWASVEGERTLGEVLGTAPAALAHWRAEAVRVLSPLVAEFAASEAFTAWLARG